jgi:hypothetical protein
MNPADAQPSRAEEALARETYWAQDTAAAGQQSTARVRNALHDLALQLRGDEELLIPQGEGNLASPSRWRRKFKYQIWRATRPATKRYDRLVADLAELSSGLADRVMALEAELELLTSAVDRPDDDPQPDGDPGL